MLAASDVRIQLRQQIAQAYNQLTAAQAILQVCRRQADATAVAYQAAQKRFGNGGAAFVELHLAKTSYDRAQSGLVQARYG